MCHALVVGFVLALPAAASANTALVLPTGGTAARASDTERIVARFVERLAAAGWRTRIVAAAQRQHVAAVLTCDTSACARAGLDSLHVEAIVAPAVWQRVDGRRELTISAQGPSGRVLELAIPLSPVAMGTGAASGASTNSLDAASALAEQFVARWSELRRIPLPPGRGARDASDMSADESDRDEPGDGAAEAATANHTAGAGGSRPAGDALDRRTSEDRGSRLDRDARAAATGQTRAATRRDAPARRSRSAWNVALGSTLLVASVAPIALGVAAVVRDDDCVRRAEAGGCLVGADGSTRRYHAGRASYAMLAAGAVGAAASVYVLAAGPIRVRSTAVVTDQGASVVFDGTF